MKESTQAGFGGAFSLLLVAFGVLYYLSFGETSEYLPWGWIGIFTVAGIAFLGYYFVKR